MNHAAPSLSPRWTGRSKGGPWGHRIFLALIRAGGPLPAYALLFFVAGWYALTDRCSSRWIRDLRRRLGLRTNFLDLHRHFFSFGMSLIDRFVFLLRAHAPFRYSCVREDRIAAAARQGRGVILLGAHAGNWELAGNLLADRLNVPVNVIAYDNEKAAVKRIFDAAMRARRIHVIAIGGDSIGVSIQIVKALRAGQIVCLHGDRLLDQRSERVTFLGAPASFPLGPYALAAIAKCPIIPVFAVKTGLFSYVFEAFEPIRFEGVTRGERENALRQGLLRFVRILEEVIRRHPWEWHNYYAFWDGENE